MSEDENNVTKILRENNEVNESNLMRDHSLLYEHKSYTHRNTFDQFHNSPRRFISRVTNSSFLLKTVIIFSSLTPPFTGFWHYVQ